MRKVSFSARPLFLLFALVGVLSGGVFYKTFEARMVAALSNVTLNNGVTTLDEAVSLSSQEDLSVGEIGAYTWTKDSANLMALNMPFNSGGTQNDYSGYGNNGTVTDAVVTTAGCQVGTCLAFDGNADYVTIPDSAVWSFSDELTVSLWFSSTQADIGGQALVSQGESSGEYSFLMWASGGLTDDNMSFYIQTNPAGITAVGCSAAEGTLFDGEWHHYVGVYDRSQNEIRMYIDGAPACNTLAVVNQPLIDYAGGVHLGRLPFSTSYTNGILDEVQVYSSVLSENQIDRLYTDGSAQSGGPTVIEADETTVGEVWDLTITPITTAGTVGSPIDSANTVTITGVLPPPPPPALGVDLCTSGGEAADDRLDAGETSFDGMTVSIVNCTFTINGEHSFANITIGDGTGSNDSVLNHTATTTTDVFRLQLTVTGSTVIDSDGIINLDGRGFPLGYTTNGAGGVTAQTGVSGNCGGSHGGYGGCHVTSGVSTPVYGSITQPLDPGAGAIVTTTGTAGGGYLKLTTDHLILDGTISMNGNPSAASTGAGGGAWITTTGSVSMAGIIRANGGGGVNGSHGSGAGGRIAFHYNSSAYSNPTPHTLFANLQAQTGVPSGVTAANVAAAGTIYIEDTSSHTPGQGSLFAKNNASLTPYFNMYTPVSGNFHDLRIQDRATIVTSTITLAGDLDINNLGVLTHPFTTTSVVNRLLVTVAGETNIEAGGSINVSGRGFIQGYTSDGVGGTTVTGASTPNSGGSHGGRGGIATGAPGIPAQTYDDFKEPTEPGGGAGNDVSGVGGGYVKLVTGSLVLGGTINADGAFTSGGVSSGAGGGLWISVSDQVDITGTIRANGGQGPSNNFHGYGGGGRIAFYYDSSTPGNSSVSLLRPMFIADSGSGTTSTSYGSAGTIYIEDSSVHPVGVGDLYISNNNLTSATTFTPLSGDVPNLILENGAKVISSTMHVFGDFVMTDASLLTHESTTSSTVYRLDVTVDGDTTIDATSSVDVSGKGFLVGYTSNGAGGTTTTGASAPNSGGSHGGSGGSAGGTPGVVYGSFRQPTEPGGGAGNGTSGFGGGVLKWTTTDFTLAGSINASGIVSSGGVSSGAGGSVWITASGVVSLPGNIYTSGGAGPVNASHAYGSGGRVAIYYDGAVSGNPNISTLKAKLHAYTGSGTGSTNYGAAGTIYIEDLSEHVVGQGILIVDNNNINGGVRRTPLFVVGQGYTTVTVDDLYVNDLGDLLIDTPCSGTPAFTISGTIDLSGGGIITNNQPGTCTVNVAALAIATTVLPNAYSGEAYSQTLQLSGGYAPFTWSVSVGSLPDGLNLNASTGEISGIPTANGINTFTVQVADSNPGGVQVDDQELSIEVTDVPTVPDAIANLTATAGGEQVTLTWTAPNANASAITDYVVQYGETSGFPGNAVIFNDGVSASTGATVTGLTNDIEYSFRVAAVNSEGQGLYSNVDTATPSISAGTQISNNADITVDINDFLSFSISNLAVGNEAAGDQPFGAGSEITDLTSTGNNDYAISGDFGPPVFTRLQTTTNSNDGYNVIAYASNLDGRTNTLLRSGGTPGSAADEISDSLNRLPSSQAPNEALVTSSDSGIAFRLIDASTSSIIREADEDTQWGDGDAGTALWASFPLGSGAAQVIFDTLTYSSSATTAYINWFVGISPQQRSGSYSGQVTFTASVN